MPGTWCSRPFEGLEEDEGAPVVHDVRIRGSLPQAQGASMMEVWADYEEPEPGYRERFLRGHINEALIPYGGGKKDRGGIAPAPACVLPCYSAVPGGPWVPSWPLIAPGPQSGALWTLT